jgi:hypothetical protein
MSYWIFQATTDDTDFSAELREGRKYLWRVTRYLHQMAPEDTVFFWQAGSPKVRGIYAWGTLESQAYRRGSDDKCSVEVRIVRKLGKPLTVDLLGIIPELEDLSILKNAQGTNFKLTKAQATGITLQLPHDQRPLLAGPDATKTESVDVPVVDGSRMLGIILGASEWPEDTLESSPAFLESARDFARFLRSVLHVPAANLLNLFDRSDSPGEIDRKIQAFLQRSHVTSRHAKKLLLFYSGHGGFSPNGRDYLLTTRSTRSGNRGVSSIRIIDLAHTLWNFGRDMQKFLILDCCFAANAAWVFQSDPLDMAVQRTEEVLPPTAGTALLCSSSARDVSIAPKGERRTMFSGALLEVLNRGVVGAPALLSLEDVGNATTRYLQQHSPGNAVRPEVHVPDQRKGNVAKFGLFPNRALSSTVAQSRSAGKADAAIEIENPTRYAEIPSFPAPRRDHEDSEKGRWGREHQRDGRRLSAVVRKLEPGWYKADLIVESTDGTQLRPPVIFHLHESFPKSVQKIIKIRDGRTAIFEEIDITGGPFTVGVEVKRADDKLIPLELDLANSKPFKNRRRKVTRKRPSR